MKRRFNKDMITLDDYRKKVYDYCENQLSPNIDKWIAEGGVPESIYEEMAAEGFFKLCTNNDEMGVRYRVILAEALGKVKTLSFACNIINTLNMPLFLLEKFPNDITNKYLDGIYTKGRMGAIAVTEENGGSDLVNSIKTTLKEEDGKLILNGKKEFILNLPGADFVIVFVKSDTVNTNTFSFSLVLVPTDIDGVTIERKKTSGIRLTNVGEISFNNCVLPKEYLLGKKGNGIMYMSQALTSERVIGSVSVVSMVQDIIRETINYMETKELFDSKLLDMQVVRHNLADMTADYEIMRSYLYDLIEQYSLKKLSNSHYQTEVAKMKLICSTKCIELVQKCNHMFGGQGFLMENWISRAYLDMLGTRFFAGTNETMKQLISQRL